MVVGLSLEQYLFSLFAATAAAAALPPHNQSPASLFILCTRGKLIEKKCCHATAVQRIGRSVGRSGVRLFGVQCALVSVCILYMLNIIMFRVNYKIINGCMSAHGKLSFNGLAHL